MAKTVPLVAVRRPLFVLLMLAAYYKDGFQLTAAYFGVFQRVVTRGDSKAVWVLLLLIWVQLVWMGVCIVAISGAFSLNGDRQMVERHCFRARKPAFF